MNINIYPNFKFNKISFKSTEGQDKPFNESQSSVASPIHSNMYSGIFVNIKDQKNIERVLNNIKKQESRNSTSDWHYLATNVEKNSDLVNESDISDITAPMLKALNSDSLKERGFATRVFRARSKYFPADKNIISAIIQNFSLDDDDILRNVCATTLSNCLKEGKLTDDHINEILPILEKGVEKNEEHSHNFLRFLGDLIDNDKVNKDNIGNIPNILARKVWEYPTNYDANNAVNMLKALDDKSLLETSYIKYLSEGLTSSDINHNKRALYYLNNNVDSLNENNARYVAPKLVSTISSPEGQLKLQTLKLVRTLYDRGFLNDNELNLYKPVLLYQMGEKNPIVAGYSANVVNKMISNGEAPSMNFSKNIINVIKNMDSDNEVTRSNIRSVVSRIADYLPGKSKSVIMQKGLDYANSDDHSDRIQGLEIVKNYVMQDELYEANKSQINKLIVDSINIDDPIEGRNIRRIFDNIYDVNAGNENVYSELNKMVYDYIVDNDRYTVNTLPFLKTMVKYSAIDKKQASQLVNKLIPNINNSNSQLQAETLSLLSRIVNKHMLTPEEEKSLTQILNNVEDVSDSIRATFERELLSRSALTEDNKKRTLVKLYENLNNPDLRTRAATLNVLPNLYTRGFLPKGEYNTEVSNAVCDAIQSDHNMTRNAGMKAFGDMVQLGATSQEDLKIVLPIIKNEVLHPKNRISAGIACKTFGQMAWAKAIECDDAKDMEQHILKYLKGSDVINKTIAMESLSNFVRLPGYRLSHTSIINLNGVIAELFKDHNISVRGSVLKSMTSLEKIGGLSTLFSKSVSDEIINEDLSSNESRHRTKALNLLRILKIHDKLTPEQLAQIDDKLAILKEFTTDPVANDMIKSYEEAFSLPKLNAL